MKKLMTVGAIVSLAVGLVLIEAGPASAAHHRHRRNHKHKGLHCGAGTHRSGNQCVPDQTTSPGGGGGGGGGTGGSPGGSFGFGCTTAGSATLSPCSVSLTRTSPTTGSFSGTFTASGLPTGTSFTVSPFGGGACPMTGGGGPFVSGTGLGLGGGGSISFPLANAGTCQPGTYAITITETAFPNSVFTGFLTTTLSSF